MAMSSGRSRREEIRRLVAREAAWLLYTGQAEEYKMAKERAARALGARILPSNLEVAIELDRLADELEGPERARRLVEARREALSLMKVLRKFHPRLVGSVWRGIAHEGSDIDVEVFWDEPGAIEEALRGAGYDIRERRLVEKQEDDVLITCYHIYVPLPSGREAEVIVRPEAERFRRRRCEIFGDELRGLTPEELERLLIEEPLKKFLPI